MRQLSVFVEVQAGGVDENLRLGQRCRSEPTEKSCRRRFTVLRRAALAQTNYTAPRSPLRSRWILLGCEIQLCSFGKYWSIKFHHINGVMSLNLCEGVRCKILYLGRIWEGTFQGEPCTSWPSAGRRLHPPDSPSPRYRRTRPVESGPAFSESKLPDCGRRLSISLYTRRHIDEIGAFGNDSELDRADPLSPNRTRRLCLYCLGGNYSNQRFDTKGLVLYIPIKPAELIQLPIMIPLSVSI